MDYMCNAIFAVSPYKNLTQAELNNKLLELSSAGDLSEVTAVLRHGADINATKYFDGDNALMLACTYGHTATAAFLLQNGADINAKNNFDYNALMYACSDGYTDTAAFLLQNGADINATRSFGYNVLMYACMNGCTDTAAFLLKKGADINATDSYGSNALMIACTYGHTDTAAFLLKNGADINPKNNTNDNALMTACKNRKTDTAYLLLNRMTPEEQEAFANQNNDTLNLVNDFKENLHKNALTVYDKMRFERWKIEPNSIFELLPPELRNYIRDFEAQLSVKEKFKDSWYRLRAFSDMNLVAQCCAPYSIDKPIFPVLFLSNKRKAQGESEENNNSNKRMRKIEERMEIDDNSNKRILQIEEEMEIEIEINENPNKIDCRSIQ